MIKNSRRVMTLATVMLAMVFASAVTFYGCGEMEGVNAPGWNGGKSTTPELIYTFPSTLQIHARSGAYGTFEILGGTPPFSVASQDTSALHVKMTGERNARVSVHDANNFNFSTAVDIHIIDSRDFTAILSVTPGNLAVCSTGLLTATGTLGIGLPLSILVVDNDILSGSVAVGVSSPTGIRTTITLTAFAPGSFSVSWTPTESGTYTFSYYDSCDVNLMGLVVAGTAAIP
jgi:hypothetical protein